MTPLVSLESTSSNIFFDKADFLCHYSDEKCDHLSRSALQLQILMMAESSLSRTSANPANTSITSSCGSHFSDPSSIPYLSPRRTAHLAAAKADSPLSHPLLTQLFSPEQHRVDNRWSLSCPHMMHTQKLNSSHRYFNRDFFLCYFSSITVSNNLICRDNCLNLDVLAFSIICISREMLISFGEIFKG